MLEKGEGTQAIVWACKPREYSSWFIIHSICLIVQSPACSHDRSERKKERKKEKKSDTKTWSNSRLRRKEIKMSEFKISIWYAGYDAERPGMKAVGKGKNQNLTLHGSEAKRVSYYGRTWPLERAWKSQNKICSKNGISQVLHLTIFLSDCPCVCEWKSLMNEWMRPRCGWMVLILNMYDHANLGGSSHDPWGTLILLLHHLGGSPMSERIIAKRCLRIQLRRGSSRGCRR